MAAVSATIPVAEANESLIRLFQAHHRRILVAAYRVTGKIEDAEDVVQSVFLRLANGESAAMQNAASYLYRAAVNGALDLLRRRTTAAAEPLDLADAAPLREPAANPETAFSAKELRRGLRLAIGELPPRMAEMFTLRYLEELRNSEIARLMETSQAVVAVTLHHARSKLKKRLGEMEQGNR